MPNDFRLLFFSVLAGAGVVFTVFSFPALTTGGGFVVPGATEAEFEAVFSQELSYCERQPGDINCQCFANVSGVILADNAPRVPGARYADKQDLARGQAANSC